MPKIVITEVDETTPGALAEDFDVVYIPGLVEARRDIQPCLWAEIIDNDGKRTGNYEYKGLQPNVPTLFTSVKEFESLCGTRAVQFETKQRYSDAATANGGFNDDAIPYHNIMFKEGDFDPSYIMAKELLDAGLNVLYERINADAVYEEVTSTEEPRDWKDSNYYCVKETGYTPITGGSAMFERYIPLTVEEQFSIDWNEAKTNGREFCKWNPTTTDYTNLAGKPEDWGDIDSDTAITYYEHQTFQYFELAQEFVTDGNVVEYDSKYGCYVTANYDTDLADTQYTVFEMFDSSKYFKAPEGFELSETDAMYNDAVTITAGNYYTKEVVTDNNVTYNKYTLAFSKADSEVTYYTAKDDNKTMYRPTPDDWVQEFDKYYTNIDVYKAVEADSMFNSAENDYYYKNNGMNVKSIYRALSEIYSVDGYEGLFDLGNYSIKYLTSGGYPTYEYQNNAIVTKMLNLAEKRGDCVAFIDPTDNPYRESDINLAGSLYKTVEKDVSLEPGEFGTMFTPWATYNRTTTDKKDNKDSKGNDVKEPLDIPSIRLSATYAYLVALADSIKTNAPWLAIAGASRGQVLNLAQNGMTTLIPNGAADAMQPRSDGRSINAITNINPYGFTIWGNRTLKANEENLVATSFLNVRNLISDVKKTCYRACRKLTFEQNNDVLWVNFKSLIAPTLDRMLSGYGISGYKFVRDTEHEKAAEKATLCAKIILYPTYPVEDFYITIVLKDDEITVE